MKLTILSLFIMSLCGPLALAKERVELRPSVDMAQAGTVDYSFDLIDTNTGKPVSNSMLAIDMEKNLHMIVYDPSLKEFQHVHPEFDGKTWKVQMNFTVNGHYWVWAQGKLKKGSVEFLTPYLGAFAHVVAVPSAGDSLQHVHAMDISSDEGMLHTTFPAAGEYRLWIQFVDGGTLKVIPLSVVVTK